MTTTMRALITGITGQDGSYLAEQLLEKGLDVHGVVRDLASAQRAPNLAAARERVTFHEVRLDDIDAVRALVEGVAPDRVFHLAAESYAGHGGFDARALTFNVSSTIALLDALRAKAPRARFLLAGSGQQLAGAATSPQNEATAPAPLTPYALSKQLACDAVRFFREREGLFAATALLYNHESARRGERFVSRKIARAAALAARDEKARVSLGDLDARRDWGFAPEYTEGMRRMLELAEPCDLVLATGRLHTVRAMAQIAFRVAGRKSEAHIDVDPRLVRPREPVDVVGDASRARALIGWEPQTPFTQMIEGMVDAEMRALSRTAPLAGESERAR